MTKKKYKILIMSAPIGSGHALAAEALKEEFEKNDECEILLGSAFDFFPAILGKIVLRSYLAVLKHIPGLYEIAYKWGNNPSGSLWLRNIINNLLAFLADNYLRKSNPDVVIATHATPAGIISAYKKKYKDHKLLLASVITDFTIHKWWLCEGTDAYFLAADDLKPAITPLPGQELHYYGIPVRSAFRQKYNREEIRKKFGWKEDSKVCLLMGGGEGLLPMKEILQGIIGRVPKKTRFVAITGRNKKLALELKNMSSAFEVYGFTEKIAELMHGADIIISKAGGLTAAETITTKLTYIIYKPLPGQEEANAEYLKSAGAADIANTPEDVLNIIEAYWNETSCEILNLAKPEAAKNIAKTIIDRLES
ncbi:MAG: hypothetical protein EOL98_01050 [Negativicutes bacterium]|nr:hypothetical protein [Negativicutes bacterium]